MKLIEIYQCLCDRTRLRILHLLLKGPLCVCHLQDIIGESQVNISRHLSYLKNRGLVKATRHHTWKMYQLPAKPSPELEANLKCLQDCLQTEPEFKADLAKLKKLMGSPDTQNLLAEACCPPAQRHKKRQKTC